MDDYQICSESGETSEIVNCETIQIKQNEINYDLNIESQEDKLTLSIIDKEQFPSVNYIRTMSLKEIKEISNGFHQLNSNKDFYHYFKLSSINKTLSLKKNKDTLLLIMLDKGSIKHEKIEIVLIPDKKDLKANVKEINQEILNIRKKIKEFDDIKNENNELRKEIDILKPDNKELKQEINYLKNENKELMRIIGLPNKDIILKNTISNDIMDKSVIMNEDENSLIFSEIENKMNMKIKKLKKLYQATIDGGAPINFHKKCDNIPNTLVLIKSEGQRRFGGFTPIPWKSEEIGVYVKDIEKKTFIFSLDKKKIYYLKHTNCAVYHKNYGPNFGRGPDIGIEGNPIEENKLRTYQSSYDYNGDILPLSEYKSPNFIKALEYEVYQIIFY